MAPRNPARPGALIAVAIAVVGCGGADVLDAPSPMRFGACQVGEGLNGVDYDVGKSRFAFGSPPVRDDQFGAIRWVGAHGVVAIQPNGAMVGLLNGDAPERSLPYWSEDPNVLSDQVVAYFVSLGVELCQIERSNFHGGGSRSVVLSRGFETIPIVESVAYGDMRNNDQTTTEGLYWPRLSAEVAAAARAFHERLSDPVALAAYKAKLPADAQGDGRLVVHHSNSASMGAFEAAALYDFTPPLTPGGSQPTRSFDADGNEVMKRW